MSLPWVVLKGVITQLFGTDVMSGAHKSCLKLCLGRQLKSFLNQIVVVKSAVMCFIQRAAFDSFCQLLCSLSETKKTDLSSYISDDGHPGKTVTSTRIICISNFKVYGATVNMSIYIWPDLHCTYW